MDEADEVDEMDAIQKDLWNAEISQSDYPDTPYQRDLVAQYMMCVEMADRISARRGNANTFFLTLHTAIIGAISGYIGTTSKMVPPSIILVAATVLVVFCIAWGLLLYSYRRLNSAKYKVIGLMEKQLPASPYFSAEWRALGLGKDWKKYIPLSLLEITLPSAFLIVYFWLAYIALSAGT